MSIHQTCFSLFSSFLRSLEQRSWEHHLQTWQSSCRDRMLQAGGECEKRPRINSKQKRQCRKQHNHRRRWKQVQREMKKDWRYHELAQRDARSTKARNNKAARTEKIYKRRWRDHTSPSASSLWGRSPEMMMRLFWSCKSISSFFKPGKSTFYRKCRKSTILFQFKGKDCHTRV